MPISHAYKCIFVHIPKCAGTSIEKALDIFGDNPANLFGYDPNHKIAMQHLTIGQMLDWGYITKEMYHTYFKFAFVRDPYDRALSSAAYHDISLLSFLKNDPREWQGKVRHGIPFIWHIDQHLKPQKDYVYHDSKLAVDFIGKYENLAADWATVVSKLNIDKDLPRTNQSKHEGYRQYYGRAENALADRLYRDDFDTFGYRRRKLAMTLL